MQCLKRILNVTCLKACSRDCITLTLCGLCGDVNRFVFVSSFLCITMYRYFVFFSHSFYVFLVLLVCRFFLLFPFLVASFDGLRPLLVASHCSFCSVVSSYFMASLSSSSVTAVGSSSQTVACCFSDGQQTHRDTQKRSSILFVITLVDKNDFALF